MRTPRRYRTILDAVKRGPAPTAMMVTPVTPAGSVAVLPGAYNPPTRAHIALAAAARARGFDGVLFSLGTTTIDKPQLGLTLEERVHLLTAIAARRAGHGVVVHNRGLYAEQAQALREAFPQWSSLTFLVGMDKMRQLFDPRYYEDVNRSLRELFERARLLVAARGTLDRDALERLLAQPSARPFAERVDWLEVDPAVRDISSTAVRERLERGERVSEWLPAAVERYVRRRAARFTN
jgi:nicotinamide-nucleotide adenylyltransferase